MMFSIHRLSSLSLIAIASTLLNASVPAPKTVLPETVLKANAQARLEGMPDESTVAIVSASTHITPHLEADLLSHPAQLQKIRYAWGQLAIPVQPPEPLPSSTFDRVWLSGCRWWQIHMSKL